MSDVLEEFSQRDRLQENDEAKELKRTAINILCNRWHDQRAKVAAIDARLGEYFDGLCEHSSVDDVKNDWHNIYELLGAIRFLRLMRRYEFNERKVRQIIRLREGVWRKVVERWQHVKGGLRQPGTAGPQVYRWEPFQVFTIASVFGFLAWVDTELKAGERDLLPTERIEDGKIVDLRRLCNDFTLYCPRKVDKTGMSAFLQVVFFFLEDFNAEIYCCANSSDQSKLLYRRTKMLLSQLDDGNRLRMTETVCDWRERFKSVRDSSIRPLSAGGKTKDGMYAQLCCADEYGSAEWINGKSDMKMLVDVVTSSMGPRREPLLFITTTAGRVKMGPFMERLDGLHRMLLKELDYDDPSNEQPTLSEDRALCLCLEPDPWERDEEYLLTSRDVRKKINPMLGRIVQHQFYDDEIAKARMSGDTAEVITKLFNVYQSAARHLEWVKPERIRDLQTERRIEDCTADKGWVVFCGMDFSQGNDLHAMSYLAARADGHGGTEFFADMDAWINEETLRTSTISELYHMWIKAGWLHLCEGEVFQPSLPVMRIKQLFDVGVQFAMWGYDAYQSMEPINTLKAYLLEQMGVQNPEAYVMSVSQTYASYNPAVDDLTYCIKAVEPLIHFSPNPLWPWEFGSVVLDEDQRMNNKKPIKRNPGSDACKVDNVQCLCTGFILHDKFEGIVHK